jgi:hypothetical protein
MLNYNFNNLNFYIFTLLFSAGNLMLPLIVHYFSLGGNVFLPIYFFILIGSYKFGLRVGLATAIITPIINHLITGMPNMVMIYPVLIKGISFALISYYISQKTKKINFQNLLLIIFSYQFIGFLFEIFYLNLEKAFNNVITAWPGLLIQLILGYLILRGINNYGRKKLS